jgi:hypothetical protein
VKAWVVLDSDGTPLGLCETSQDVCLAAAAIARMRILDNDERPDSDAEGLIIVPAFDGDALDVSVYIARARDRAYLIIAAHLFDSATPIEETL